MRPKIRSNIEGYLFILPAFAFFCIFIVYTVGNIFYFGTFDWDGISLVRKFVGLANYVELFSGDRIFLLALRNTAYWIALTIPIQMILGLFLAILLDLPLKGRVIYRVIFFMPVVTSPVVVGAVWGWLIYNPQSGILNHFLKAIGLNQFAFAWTGDPSLAIFSCILVNIWQWTGFSFVLYLAGLQTIPLELYEVAAIDGAGYWQRIRFIILPMLMPVHFTLTILGVIGTLKTFDVVYMLTRGGPNHSSTLLPLDIFHEGFMLYRQGYASAISVILFLIALSTTIIQMSYYRKTRG